MAALSVLCLMAISCSSPTGSDSRAPNPQHSFSRSEPGVYVGGTYVEPSVRPCYWRDGEIVEVACHSRNESGIIGACFNDNGTIHFAGSQNDVLSIWTNRYRKDLTGETGHSPTVNAMFVRGSDTYIVGRWSDSAVLWVNGEMTRFIDKASGNSGTLEGIYVDETLNTHICGTENNRYPLYWNNGTRQTLATPVGTGTTNDITMAGGHVYITGSCYNGVDRSTACYWVDGVRHDLDTPGTDSSKATAIYIDGSDIYIGGYYYASSNSEYACYWKNGTLVVIGDRRSQISDIVVSSGKVYACGLAWSNNLSEISGSYWIDGVQHELPSLYNDAETAAFCIVVN